MATAGEQEDTNSRRPVEPPPNRHGAPRSDARARRRGRGRGGRVSVAIVGLTNPDTAVGVLDGVIRAARECGRWNLRTLGRFRPQAWGRHRDRLEGLLLMSSASADLLRVLQVGVPVVTVNFVPESLSDAGPTPDHPTATTEPSGSTQALGGAGASAPPAGRRSGVETAANWAGSVVSDESAVGAMVAEHLWSQGLRHLAYIGFDHPCSRAREAAFVAAARRRGARVECPTSSWPWERVVEVSFVAWAMRGLPSPVGVFAFNDEVAARAVEAALRLRRRVPDDVAVVGVDNARLRWQMADVPLSSVDLRLAELGYRAARLLGEAMSKAPMTPRVEVVRPGGVVVRASSDILAIDDPLVAETVRLVRSEACESLTAAEVVARAPAVSRSTLERRFREVVGRSIGEEIRRVRLDRARQLIEAGGMSLTEIALQCGFSDLPHLTRQFTRHYGKPPSAWRADDR